MELSEKNFLMFGLAVLIAIATAFMPYAISHGIDGRMRMTFPKPHFSLAEMPPLRDKVALVTGAASGIGQVTAIELARAGAHVVIGVRASRCGSALQAIKGASGSNSVQCLPVDLASLASVADFANAFREEKLPLHILVLNAGVMAPEWGVTVDGVEQQFGVNHLGHFALTNFLVDILKSSAPARVVTVTSAAAFLPDVLSAVIGRAPPNYTDVLADAQPRYWRWEKYAESKLANILFTQELARRLAGTRVFCNSVHPGAVSTELTRHVASSWRGTAVLGWLPGWGALVDASIGVLSSALMMPPEAGALSQLYLAVSPTVEQGPAGYGKRGRYFIPIAREAPPPSYAHNLTMQNTLWAVSEELTTRFLHRRAPPRLKPSGSVEA